MSERTPNRRPAPRRSRAFPVYAASAALFVGTFGFLGVRMADGHDPSLGPGRPVAALPAKQVLVRKVVVTRKIVVVKPAPTEADDGSASAGSTPVTSAPAASAPAPVAAAPAPAPAPAPVQTASS